MRPQHRVQWHPPPANYLKLNFNGAIVLELGKAGLGVIVHDCHGSAITSLLEQASLPFSPVIVEAMAAARALTFAQCGAPFLVKSGWVASCGTGPKYSE